MNQAAMVQVAARVATQPRDGGSRPTSPLPSLMVRPIPVKVAKELLVLRHYLHSLAGGSKLAFGVFLENRLLGALTWGVGSFNSHSLVEGANPEDCLTLTRLWLSDELPANSESRVLGVMLRSLRRRTTLKFVLTSADPSRGHRGGIYMASGWTYTGLSEPTPMYDLGDGKARHSRSLAHAYGTHSVRYFQKHGVLINTVPQSAKHRYIYFLNHDWRSRLKVSVLPYPKRRDVQ